ncbi:hypothetical protein ZYGR_0E01250 [Zygosaccharomyces rouxii]|uniref:ZYRO0B02750p n=2 Tax=Zygosaccharomyces rouxii TaxID=4956 RepID=C5DQT1_ZYGRC|nr:uncharacterized protein ZYRO0B02750g [Zygosaccharomyces rouxii]GAV47110.1 hypothetical protein ZYGR_0E01250 [Zygosaccharomyces rouxii]CAR26142.1 ZYRO0B02750p [Zygosaccharomyces rouxii]
MHYTNENLDLRRGKDFKEAYNFSQFNFDTAELNQRYNQLKNVYRFPCREHKSIVQGFHANAKKITRLLSLPIAI